ncbi:MAG TPA: tRNA (adenosine(37)-N6)-dimethylallyltransferase MiaA [bacterium]|nr:tRNA (adenosine(37)-N6)-dimethylallyltransferase MiaA [bacterium]
MGSASLVVLAGPTAVGKTPVAIALAERVRGEIVCADSRTLYRGMDIGTDKPTARDRERVPHYLLDVARPDEVVTLAAYQRLALGAIAEIRRRGRLPLLVGGTGLYIRAVVDGLQIPPAAPDWSLRAALEAEERAGGPGSLHGRLREVDPAAAVRIHPRNLRRIIRALEVHAVTGVPISVLQQSSAGPPPGAEEGSVVMIALTTDRVRLYERIHHRIDQHLAAGLVEEVRALVRAGYPKSLPALQGLGYKELIPYVEGSLSLGEAKALLQRNTRRYAKRQLTWFRSDPRYRWLDVGADPPEVVAGRIRAMIWI